MRGTNTLENVIGLAHEMSTDNYDEFMPVREMQFESLEQIDIAGQAYKLERTGGQILGLIKQ